MFNSSVLDVTLGLVVVFLLVSTVCTAIREGLESVLKTRAAYLERAIRELLADPDGKGTARDFFKHPLINGLFRDAYVGGKRAAPWLFAYGGKLPSYIPARDFAKTLIDLAARHPAAGGAPGQPISLASLRSSVAQLPDAHLQRIMLTALDAARHDVDEVRQQLEAWFDASMERVSGWYKRTTQLIILVIAAVVVGVLNVDSISIADTLYHDQAARGAAVAAAAQLKPDSTNVKLALEQLDGKLKLPIGWAVTPAPANPGEWLLKVLGLLLTAFAATLGAPFWFDVLNKVTMIRGSLKPESKRELPALQPVAAGVAAQLRDVSLPRVHVDNDRHAELDDGCALPLERPTPDEALPPARGG